jgi:pilus assembly protein Flp/PilA
MRDKSVQNSQSSVPQYVGPRTIGSEGGVMKNLVARLVREDSGQDLVEYALLVSLIALVVVSGMGTISTALNNLFGRVGGRLDTP